jgi:hypothetical protein
LSSLPGDVHPIDHVEIAVQRPTTSSTEPGTSVSAGSEAA